MQNAFLGRFYAQSFEAASENSRRIGENLKQTFFLNLQLVANLACFVRFVTVTSVQTGRFEH